MTIVVSNLALGVILVGSMIIIGLLLHLVYIMGEFHQAIFGKFNKKK